MPIPGDAREGCERTLVCRCVSCTAEFDYQVSRFFQRQKEEGLPSMKDVLNGGGKDLNRRSERAWKNKQRL